MNELIAGQVERLTYHNPENGFCIVKVKVKSEKDLIPVLGYVHAISAGMHIKAHGAWIQDKRWGRQFKAENITIQVPSTVYGIEKYLSSGIIKGIRDVTAKRLMKAFGKRVFEVLDNEPEKLKTVAGLPEKQVKRILNSWADHRSVRALIELLGEFGVSPSQVVKIHKRYGTEAEVLIKANPYCLVYDIRGIGFASADRIAQGMGWSHESHQRVQAGITYALTMALEDGHCCLPIDMLVKSTEKLLEVPTSIVEEALISELASKKVVSDIIRGTECIFLLRLHKCEMHSIRLLKCLISEQMPWSEEDILKPREDAEDSGPIKLSDSQSLALDMALRSKVMIITGGPGVGKTALMRILLNKVSKLKKTVLLAAPTGRAAKRLAEVTGMESKTIHRLLEVGDHEGGFLRDESNPLDADLVVVDEASMIDVFLFNALLKAIPKRAALLIVGDADQLPSVGPGNVLRDLIESDAFATTHLTEVYRQAQSSNIITVAHEINAGNVPQLQGYGRDSNFFFLPVADPESALEQILDITTRRLPQNMGLCPLSDIQILSSMNKGYTGTKSLNENLQRILNPPTSASLTRAGTSYSVGDKVMQIRNNYDKDVYNGDIGLIQGIDHDSEIVTIAFDDRPIEFSFSEMDDIVLSYAITIHKAQGSEYPAVIIPLLLEHSVMMQKNLVYTGMTRGRSLVIIVGDKKALELAIRNNRVRTRWSLMGEKLKTVIT